MLICAALLWEPNTQSQAFSLAYDATWALKLFNGFDRQLNIPHRNVLFTDRERPLPDRIEQIVQPDLGANGYGDCIRPYALNLPMCLVGLDTVFVGNIDKMARWCLENPGKLALPKHPYNDLSINGVQLWGGHDESVYANWRGENDMEYLRTVPHERIESLWGPEKVVSYKAHVKPFKGKLQPKTSIVYFHGVWKPPELGHLDWIGEHWR